MPLGGSSLDMGADPYAVHVAVEAHERIWEIAYASRLSVLQEMSRELVG